MFVLVVATGVLLLRAVLETSTVAPSSSVDASRQSDVWLKASSLPEGNSTAFSFLAGDAKHFTWPQTDLAPKGRLRGTSANTHHRLKSP